MNPVSLACAWLLERPLATMLTTVLLAFGVATIAALLSFDHQFRDRLSRDARGIHLVVGAKGSRLQLVLSSVYHADNPTGNIRFADAGPIIGRAAVSRAVPLSLGDSAGPFRVVGTTAEFLELRNAGLAKGRTWNEPFEAVLGPVAARELGLGIGSRFETSHGLGPGSPGHARRLYTVTGILAPTGSVTDRLVLTSLESIWDVHSQRTPGSPSAGNRQLREPEITAILLTFASPVRALAVAAEIDRQSAMMTAFPAMEAGRLFALLGPALDVLRGFGIVLMASAALAVFTTLTSALEMRRRDIAVLRALGAVRQWTAGVLLAEATILTLSGTLLGFVLGHFTLWLVGVTVAGAASVGLSGLVFAPGEGWLLLGALLTGIGSAGIPIVRACSGEVSEILAGS